MELFKYMFIENGLLWRMLALFAVYGAGVYSVSRVLRKILGVERKKLFGGSDNYVNERHRQMDRYLRLGGGLVAVAAVLAFGFENPWLLFAVLLATGAVVELYTAYMQKTHAGHSNDYLFTLLQLPAVYTILLVCMSLFFPEFFSSIKG